MADHTRKRTFRDSAATLVDRITARRMRGKVVPIVLHPDTLEPYPITYRYGIEDSSYSAGHHTGEDHACPIGSLAIAPTWGHVTYVGDGSGRWGAAYGLQVIIRTKDGRFEYAHNHLSKTFVKVGDVVVPGMVVAHTGNTGNSTGPHDHFEVRPAGGRYGSDLHPLRVKRMAP